MGVSTITKENFEKEVLQSAKPVLVDFWAPWCRPCLMVSPLVEEISEERSENLKVGKINVDEQPELASKYGIMSIPALILFADGKLKDSMIGAVPKENILKFIDA
ncbi:MAG: thioredoxin [Selenomonadaceae bacterium]